MLDFNRALLLLRLLRLLTRRPQWAQLDLHRELQIPGGVPDLNRELQIAVPDLNRDFQVAVGTAGPQPRAPDPSGHCRTSTASSRSQWALPDLNRELQIPVGTAGPQRPDRMPEDMPDRMPEDLPDRMPEDMPEHMPDRMPEDMSDRMPEDLPVRKCINVMVGITRSEVFFVKCGSCC